LTGVAVALLYVEAVNQRLLLLLGHQTIPSPLRRSCALAVELR